MKIKLNIVRFSDDLIEDLSYHGRNVAEWLEDTSFLIKEILAGFISRFRRCPACKRYSMRWDDCTKCSYRAYFESKFIREETGWIIADVEPSKIEYYKGFELIDGEIYQNNIFIGKAPIKEPFRYIEKLSLL